MLLSDGPCGCPAGPEEADSGKTSNSGLVTDLLCTRNEVLEPAKWGPYLTGLSETLVPPVAHVGPFEPFSNADQLGVAPSWSNWSLAGCANPGVFAVKLVEGISQGQFAVGMEAFFKEVKHNASSDAIHRRQGLFPLPVSFVSCLDFSEDHQKDEQEVQAWLALTCYALNGLAGWHGPTPKARKSKQAARALECIEDRIRRFLRSCHVCSPLNAAEVWEDLKRKKISYDGEEFSEPMELTVDQIRNGLPPAGHGGAIDLVPLLVGQARYLVQNPMAVLLDEDLKEPGPNSAKVHIKKGEELGVWKLLESRGVVGWLREENVYRDSQGPYLSGMFGVEKPNKKSELGAPLLRTIMNLKPINRALRIIQGDIGELPCAAAWLQLSLEESDHVKVSQADMSSAFYLFRLPSAWHRYLCFNSRFQGSQIGKGAGTWVPCCLVLPMGWSSSVGLMQMASRELLRRTMDSSAAELRRQAVVPAWFVDVLARSKGKQFWQVYLDNFMASEITPSAEGDQSQQLHAQAVEAWDAAGVLCAADKHVMGATDAVELGVNINGDEGLIGGSPQRFHKLLCVTMILLQQRLPKVKWVQMVLGRWIFVLQYRRAAMAALSQCWEYTKKGQDRRRWWPVVQRELSSLLCLTPLLQFDLRMKFSGTTTCSDASHYGGAVAIAESLSSAGNSFCHRAATESFEPVQAELLCISAFNGIGGSFRGYDLAGLKPAGLISIEVDKAARRVTRKAWPQVVEIGDIETITLETVREWFNTFPRVRVVHLIGGFPCIHLSAVRAGRRNLQGEGSVLFWKLLDLLHWLEEVFKPTASVEFLIENVLSMDSSARDEISSFLGVEPLALCPSDVLCYNRPRLAWMSMEVEAGPGVELWRQSGFTRVWMTAEAPPDEDWLQEGWQRCDPTCKLPTFMKSIVRKHPPPMPAGIERCPPDALQRWESDSFRFAPYQYKLQHLLRDAEGHLRYPSADERERLLGFGTGHTSMAFSAGISKEQPLMREDKRLSLCGDSFSMLSFGWCISQMCRPWVRPRTPQEILDRFGLAPGASLAAHIAVPMTKELRYGPPGFAPPSQLVAHLSRQVNHTGSDVSLSLGVPLSAKTGIHASLRAGWWKWRILFATKWRYSAHINYLEMRVILQTIRWRARHGDGFNSRWLHLADSMVSNYVLSKGRTSSKLLQPLTREICAHLLAQNSHQLHGHVDSIENPTDEASRAPDH